MKSCYYCQSREIKKGGVVENWIIEHHFLGKYNRLLKECLIGTTKSDQKRPPIKTVFYCSITCMENQQDREEKELWEKGDCVNCKEPLAVINDNCENLEHKKLGCLLPINTPDCLKD